MSMINNEQKTLKQVQDEIFVELVLCLMHGCAQHTKYNGIQKECIICAEELKDKYVIETNCKHCFDIDCIMSAVVTHKYTSCPQCNTPFKHIPIYY